MVNKSLINASSVEILPNLSVKIPTVGEILENESNYYNIIFALTATPSQYMVQLDDWGIDYTTISDYQLFKILFPIYAQDNLSIIFGDSDFSDLSIYGDEQAIENISSNSDKFQIKDLIYNDFTIYSKKNDVEIDELVYNDLADVIRKINNLEKQKIKPGNEHARKYLIDKERKRMKKNKKKPYEPYLEKLVIALVNTSEFPYDYDSCMNLSIYRFNQSFKQIQHKIAFDKTMIGVYAGTVDTSKMNDKEHSLSWIQT